MFFNFPMASASYSKISAVFFICMFFMLMETLPPVAYACGNCCPPSCPPYRRPNPPKTKPHPPTPGHGRPRPHPRPPPISIPPITIPPIVRPPPGSGILPPIINPPVRRPPPYTPPGGGGGGGGTTPPGVSPPPGSTNATCPIDALKLGLCLDVLGGLVHVVIGDPIRNICCPVIQGLLELEAAICLCTIIRIKLLNLNIFLPLALQVLATCGLTPPPGFVCPPLV